MVYAEQPTQKHLAIGSKQQATSLSFFPVTGSSNQSSRHTLSMQLKMELSLLKGTPQEEVSKAKKEKWRRRMTEEQFQTSISLLCIEKEEKHFTTSALTRNELYGLCEVITAVSKRGSGARQMTGTTWAKRLGMGTASNNRSECKAWTSAFNGLACK